MQRLYGYLSGLTARQIQYRARKRKTGPVHCPRHLPSGLGRTGGIVALSALIAGIPAANAAPADITWDDRADNCEAAAPASGPCHTALRFSGIHTARLGLAGLGLAGLAALLGSKKGDKPSAPAGNHIAPDAALPPRSTPAGQPGGNPASPDTGNPPLSAPADRQIGAPVNPGTGSPPVLPLPSAIRQNPYRPISLIRSATLHIPDQGAFINTGTLSDTTLAAHGPLHNGPSGRIALHPLADSHFHHTLRNHGTIDLEAALTGAGSGRLINAHSGVIRLSGKGTIRATARSLFINDGTVTARHAIGQRSERFILMMSAEGGGPARPGLNTGTLIARGGYGAVTFKASDYQKRTFINRGNIDFTAENGATRALHIPEFNNFNTLINDRGGIITVRGNHAVAMGSNGMASHLVNRGTINLGVRDTADFGMAAMEAGAWGKPDGRHPAVIMRSTLLNDTEGVINVFARHSFAFRIHRPDGNLPSAAILINRGKVHLLCGNSSCANSERRIVVSPHATQTYRFTLPDTSGLDAPDPAGPTGTGHVHLGVDGKAGGIFVNTGRLDPLHLTSSGHVHNTDSGELKLDSAQIRNTLWNDGQIRTEARLETLDGGRFVNRHGGQMLLTGNGSLYASSDSAFVNLGRILAERAGPAAAGTALLVLSGSGDNNGSRTKSNVGSMITRGGYTAVRAEAGNKRQMFINRGSIDFTAEHGATSALSVTASTGNDHDLITDLVNDKTGVITVRGDNAVAMSSDTTSQLINRGIINLGEPGSRHVGMVAMAQRGWQGSRPRSAPSLLVNEQGGIINVHARQSHAFSIDGNNALLVNRGMVSLSCGDQSCQTYRDASTRDQDISLNTAGLQFRSEASVPADDESDHRGNDSPHYDHNGLPVAAPAAAHAQSLAGYVIGTRPDGGAGTLDGGHLDASGVTVDTGFATGSSLRHATFSKVLRGKRIDGIERITSRNAAWRAQAYRDADGDIGITLIKNDYRDLVPDAALHPVAAALERGYDGSALFHSLELGSATDIGHALRQLSGAGIASSLQPLRTLEQRFARFSDDMPGNRAGFGFRLVGSRHGQPEARLGSSTYDLVALRQRFELGHDARLTARYGFASVKSGSTTNAGLNGRSQLFGLHYAQPLGRAQLEGEFRYTQHQAGTRRTLRYGDVNLRPRADQRRDQFSSQFSLAMPHTLASGLTLEPLLGLKLRHQRDAALTERDAGAYALRLSAARDSAVDGVLGLRVRYDAVASRRGWRADAELLGRPTLYRQAGIRQAGFASVPAAGRFELPASGNHRLGYDGKLGLSHHGKDSHFEISAFASRENGAGDRRIMANYRHGF